MIQHIKQRFPEKYKEGIISDAIVSLQIELRKQLKTAEEDKEKLEQEITSAQKEHESVVYAINEIRRRLTATAEIQEERAYHFSATIEEKREPDDFARPIVRVFENE